MAGIKDTVAIIEAVHEAIEDTGITLKDIETTWLGPQATGTVVTGMRGNTSAYALKLDYLPYCFTTTELITYKDPLLSPQGKAKEDTDANAFTMGDTLPVNTDGGLECFGYLLGT